MSSSTVPALDGDVIPDWHDAPGHWSEVLGRVGLGAYGVVHLLLGWLAAAIATLGEQSSVDQPGAVAALSLIDCSRMRRRSG